MMVNLSKLIPSILGLYVINSVTDSWLLPGVLAQDDGSGRVNLGSVFNRNFINKS